MNPYDLKYLNLLSEILGHGKVATRRGMLTLELLNRSLAVNAFPLLTSRRLNVKAILDEFLWEYNGHTNIRYLSHARNWWAPYADETGEVPNAYGSYVRKQIKHNLRTLKTDPYSRRIRLVIDSPETTGFPACQPYKTFIRQGDSLYMTVTSRSSDMMLGFPNDIAKDWLYLELFAHHANLKPAQVQYDIQSAHIYLNTVDQAMELLSRRDKLPAAAPRLELNPLIDSLYPASGDFYTRYEALPPIKIPFNV